MELHREDIVAGDGRREPDDVVGLAGYIFRAARPGVVAVDEVEAAAVGDAVPQRVVAHLPHPVPSHVRDLESFDAAGRGTESGHVAGEDAEATGAAVLVAAL